MLSSGIAFSWFALDNLADQGQGEKLRRATIEDGIKRGVNDDEMFLASNWKLFRESDPARGPYGRRCLERDRAMGGGLDHLSDLWMAQYVALGGPVRDGWPDKDGAGGGGNGGY